MIRTFLDFLPLEIGAALGGSSDHVGKADTKTKKFVIVVSGQWFGGESTEM